MIPQDKLIEVTTAPFFAALHGAALDALLPECELYNLSGGEYLFQAGDAGDAMYVVLSGRLRVLLPQAEGGEETVREIARGESVGELALLTGEVRSASIRAIRDSQLVRLSHAGFQQVLQTDPSMIRQIAIQLASRQRQDSDSKTPATIRTIAVLPIGTSETARSFSAELAKALTHWGKSLHVDRIYAQQQCADLVDSVPIDGAETLLGALLDRLERNYPVIVYRADSELNSWTERCVRQADLILVAVTTELNEATAHLARVRDYFTSRAITARVELVYLHGSEANSAKPTSARGQLPSAADHHHILANNPLDLAKLARFITGNAIGLVLSGGGARGFAHIGVIRALQERGIPIDFIGGTSMGAVIAAQHALGWDWQTMAKVNAVEWPRCEPQKNYTLPLVALNSARRMDQMLRRMFGEVEIQNLHRKFFCVSTNLTTARAKIHQEGPLWKAVRASVSIPGIGPPAIENGEILVDGGLVDNLPVETMKKLCRGRAYAVDVGEQVEFASKLKESYTVSGWKLLYQQINPFIEKPDIPNILNTLYRTTTVGGIRAIASAKTQADLCFEPPVSQFGVFEWQSVEKIIAAGYRNAFEKLDESAESLIQKLRS